MPGVDLNLDLPSLSDQLATIVAKLITALSAIEDDLAADVTPSEIDINTSLSMNGSALVNTGSVQFVAGNAPDAAGAMWYEDDEFWVQDATGAVRLTVNGAIDASSLGGITSLASPAAVTWDLASSEFRFTSDSGVYADLVADDLVLHSASGSVRFSVADAITTARQFNITDLPASGVSALVYDASSSALKSSENTRITNTLKATTLDISTTTTLTGAITAASSLTVAGVVDVGGAFRHPEWTVPLPTHNGDPFINSIGADYVENFVNWGKTSGAAAVTWLQLVPVRVGERIKSLTCTIQRTGVGSAFQYTLSLIKLSGGNVTAAVDGSTSTTYATGNTLGVEMLTHTLGTPVSGAADELFFFQLVMPANVGPALCSRPFATFDAVVG